ncbi:MAG: PQQ-like beta-propeller repeat protein [Treponema sp.]|nr:PQQ-like beta-propeller repeat protein [Treponema sp.]
MRWKKNILPMIFLMLIALPTTEAKSISLARTRMSWATALPGKIITQPLRYGNSYIAVHDGNGIIAFTEDGKILWQRMFDEPMTTFLSLGQCGMLFAVSKSGRIHQLRNDGTTVWTSECDGEITEPVFPGRDGRIYVRGRDFIACYGNKGTRRWKIDLEGQDTYIGLAELNEGSLMIFEQRRDSTVARTVTPFGEKMAAFLMNGRVTDAKTVKEGVLIAFSDGKVILATETDGSLYFDWKIASGPSPVIVTQGHIPGTASILSGGKSMIIRTETGRILTELPSFSTGGTLHSLRTRQGLFIAGQTEAYCYSDSGESEWTVTLNPKKKAGIIFATDSGYLILCTSSWTIEGYRIKQIPSPQDYTPPESFVSGTYSALYSKSGSVSDNLHGRAISEDEAQTITQSLSKGDFAKSEKDWLGTISKEMSAIDKQWSSTISLTQTDLPFFQKNLDYARDIITLASSVETTAFHEDIAVMLRKNTDTRRLEWLVKAAGTLAMDEDFQMLAEMGKIAQKYNKSDTLLQLICDSTYEICSYMGRDAFINYGHEILSTMMGPQYSQQTRTLARSTMEKLLPKSKE